MSAAFGGWRVCLVDCAEDLNRNSANALLKMIEEPPARSLILIVSHRPGQVLPTIRSRCRRLRLDPLDAGEIAEVVATPRAAVGARPTRPRSPRAAARAERLGARGAGAAVAGGRRRRRADRRDVAGLPHPDPRAVARLAEALAGRASTEAFDAFHRALYDWLAARAASPLRPCGWRIGGLWDRIREAARETEALNLDRKLHVLALFRRSPSAPAR